MNAICNRLGVTDDVIIGSDVETFGHYIGENYGLLAEVVFEKIEIDHLCNAQTTVGPLEPHLPGQ